MHLEGRCLALPGILALRIGFSQRRMRFKSTPGRLGIKSESASATKWSWSATAFSVIDGFMEPRRSLGTTFLLLRSHGTLFCLPPSVAATLLRFFGAAALFPPLATPPITSRGNCPVGWWEGKYLKA
eukprot:CAMPEP_0172863648 /NCGR_PEP_ID=MMETSP1075-20121228/77940_1 /TAXON_ID=2916 /ORGANISM="Ceratium fusus, Strain PA161109" /LENGTH=126 /DNA_ID=CAMNT_0013712319 /DNA_START=462 /DNA_END=842 /DNA_ORIENTATION=+